MTLKEYKEQVEPTRMPIVYLIVDECVFGSAYYVYHGAFKIKHIATWIKGIDAEYCLIHNDLWTTDSDGDSLQPSCFKLKNKLI